MIKGIDISHNNDHIEISKLSAHGIGFVWLKASQGLTYQDPMFQTYWKDCKAANMIHGAYHFFDPRFDGIQQAKNFLSRGVNFNLPGVLPPCIDVEDLVGHDEADTTKQNKWVADNWHICLQRLNDFLAYVKTQTGKDCIIYTYNGYMKEYFRGTPFINNELWLSSLQSKCPKRYDTGKPPLFWQYTYRLNNTDLDGDYFTGTQQQLNELCNIKSPIV